MATSAAHIGLQTRQDLPIDDSFFRCFSTSSSDAYVNQYNARNREYVTSFKPKPSNKLSNIQQGDLNKSLDTSYETMHDISFVRHPNSNYVLHQASTPKYQTSIIFGHKYNAPRWEGDCDDMYTSTSASTYIDKHDKLGKSQNSSSIVRGKSYIVFGEPDKIRINPSMTQIDYQAHDLSKVERVSIDPKKSSEANAVAIALAPDVKSINRTTESSEAYVALKKPDENIRSAGLDIGSSDKTSNISSIPRGDAGFFDFSTFKTTSFDDFKNYPYVPVEHPILGAKITKSKVTLGEPGGILDALEGDRYTSTTHSAFVHHPESTAALGRGVSVKPRSTLHAGDEADNIPNMENNTTTHSDHFKNPTGAERAIGFKGKTVDKKMLFPLRAHQPGIFETMTSEYFGMRRGLLFNPKEASIKNLERQSVRQLRTRSSIAFGDPHLHYYETEQQKQQTQV